MIPRANRTIAAAAAAALTAALLVATAAPASAEETCSGTIGARSIDDDVVVPAGAACTLEGTMVDGNVLVEPGARLTVRSGTTIEGNIQESNGDAGHVLVEGATVGGNIQLFTGGSATISSTQIGGDLQYESNSGPFSADGNRIDGNLQVNQNRGGVTITDNVIGGNLQCQANDPAPTGGGNTVEGDAEDQCASLDGGQAGPGGFHDVSSSSPHATAIEWLVDRGITEGCNADGTRYCPGDPVRRGQMATFLDRALDLPPGTTTFEDVPASHVHAPGISAVADAGITEGCNATGTRFCPSDVVTRAQMATFLDRALDLPPGTTTFEDVPASHAHAPGISAVADAGITEGCNATGTRYCPSDPVTRAQMASFLMRALAG